MSSENASVDSGKNYLVIDLSGGPRGSDYPYRFTDDPPNIEDDTCRTTELWLRHIPAGTFIMGDSTGLAESRKIHCYPEETAHEVTLTEDFYLGIFQCTQKQYELITGSNPSYFKGDTRPVETISFNELCGDDPYYNSLFKGSSFSRCLSDFQFFLPTEAQWEYACRLRADGTTWNTDLNSGRNFGPKDSSPMKELGRFVGNSEWEPGSKSDGRGGYGEHTKVGCYRPSEMGLYDMHGNVHEHCQDWVSKDIDYHYSWREGRTNPSGPNLPLLQQRVVRGGGWGWDPDLDGCRCSARFPVNPSEKYCYLGFRIACDIKWGQKWKKFWDEF
jgi:eukaryotic-like serine/threonine-protein kinase